MLNGAASDQIAAADQLAIEFTLGAYAADVVGTADAVSIHRDFIGPDAATTADLVTTATAYVRSAADGIGAEDAVFIDGIETVGETILGGVVTGSAYAYTVSPDGPVSASGGDDCVTAPIGFIIEHGDYLDVVDLPVIEYLFLLASDIVAMLDSDAVVNMDFLRRPQDAVAAVETLLRATDTHRPLQDDIATVDSAGLTRYVDQSDTETLSESTFTEARYERTFSDSALASEGLQLEFTFQIWVENLDPLIATEQLQVEQDLRRVLGDALALTEQAQVSLYASRVVDDQVSLTEDEGEGNVIAGTFNVIAGGDEVIAA
jgi:hypothetical protein